MLKKNQRTIGSQTTTALTSVRLRHDGKAPTRFLQSFTILGVLLTICTTAGAQCPGWSWQEHELAAGGRIRALRWLETGFVAVGDEGRIVTSPSGILWTDQNSGTEEHLLDVTVTPSGILVVVGANGTILSSSDGETFHQQSSGTALDLRGVAADRRIVVVGGNHDCTTAEGVILTSDDGLSWETALSTTTSIFHAAVTNGQSFVAVGGLAGPPPYEICLDEWIEGGQTSVIYSSVEGAQWIEHEIDAPSHLKHVQWDGEAFITFGHHPEYGGTSVWTSGDGTQWSEFPWPHHQRADGHFVANGLRHFLSSSYQLPRADFVSTHDGSSWELRGIPASAQTMAASGDRLVCASARQIVSTIDPWDPEVESFQ